MTKTFQIPPEDGPIAAMLLKHYKVRLAKLQNLYFRYADCEKTCSVAAQKYGAFRPSTGNTSDPVAKHYAALETLRGIIAKVEHEVRSVQEVFNDLKNSPEEEGREMFLVLERHVMGEDSMQAISEDTGIPLRTLYRRKSELTRAVYQKWKDGTNEPKK